ncbi:hypothetical protein GQ600_21428 [Phytophthora cactorum]|nr:hypothetical protein GQ600_21428 [Phytophthora cactorum]
MEWSRVLLRRGKPNGMAAQSSNIDCAYRRRKSSTPQAIAKNHNKVREALCGVLQKRSVLYGMDYLKLPRRGVRYLESVRSTLGWAIREYSRAPPAPFVQIRNKAAASDIG